MKTGLIVILALTMIGAGSLVAGAANLVLNPGFESLDGSAHPTDWSGPWVFNEGGVYSTPDVTISIDSTVSHSGTNSLKIVTTANKTVEFASNAIAMVVGKKYEVSGWVKTENLVTTGGNGGYLDGATYAFRSSYPPGSGWGAAVNQSIRGTTNWTFFTRTAVWDWYTGNAYLIASHNAWAPGTGTVWFDDVSVTEVPEPGSLLALGSGLIGLVAAARRRRTR